MSKYPKIHIVSMTDDTVTFQKKDFEDSIEYINELMFNNKECGEGVKYWLKGKRDILMDICSVWQKLTIESN